MAVIFRNDWRIALDMIIIHCVWRLAGLWDEEVRSRGDGASLHRVVWHFCRTRLLLSILCLMVTQLAGFSGPVSNTISALSRHSTLVLSPLSYSLFIYIYIFVCLCIISFVGPTIKSQPLRWVFRRALKGVETVFLNLCGVHMGLLEQSIHLILSVIYKVP